MDNEELNEIIKKTRIKMAISNLEKEIVMEKEKRNKYKVLKTVSIACACLILTTGVVFAKDIEKYIKEKFDFGLGKGIDVAAENGYIVKPEMEEVESKTEAKDLGILIEDIDVSTKIENFLMDDINLSVEFSFKFDEKIKEIIDLNKIHNINLSDLIIIDEENRILYTESSIGKEKFDNFCKEHNINQEYSEFNENYMNNGLNWFPKNANTVENSINLIYNMYTDTEFPTSKKLYFYFTEITFLQVSYDEVNEKKITLVGNWNMQVDVPEKMYIRTKENYRIVSCDNENFNVYTAKVSDTGFEIGILIDNLPNRPQFPEEIRNLQKEICERYGDDINQSKASEEFYKVLVQSPYKEKWDEYHYRDTPISLDGTNVFMIEKKEKTEGTYILNSNGEKFICTYSPSRKCNNQWVTDNKFDFYETFDMTKYDATDCITIIIDFYGKPVHIELEKIK